MSALMPTYARLPVTFSHGEGVYLFDTEGRRYLDGICGIGVTGLGHAHPAVTAAIQSQAGKLLHTSNMYAIGLQEQLAERLAGETGMHNCFFGNSGAEANEAAIKLARLYGHRRGVDKPVIIVLEGAFHGRTLATLSATGNRKIQAGFEPLVSGFVRAPRNDINALRQIAAHNPDVVAFLAEPIQGEGGIYPLDEDYLRAVRELCSEHGWLMMLDEVQTGSGRTGTWFAYQGMGFAPDVVTTAKGLGNGVPIGACLARGEAAEVFSAGNHASTYGGNPLVCAAALAVLETVTGGDLLAGVARRGQMLRDIVAGETRASGRVLEVRGKGLMLGFQLDRECPELTGQALEAGLLVNVTAGSTVRLLPPLIMTDDQVAELAHGVARLILDL